MSEWQFYVCGTALAVAVATVVYKRWTSGGDGKSAERKRVAGKDYPRDTVILHQFKRGPFAPSMSGFCLKLETFFKMADIPYQNIFSYKAGPKGKTPWIEYNGETFADSHFIMLHLKKTLGIDLNSELSPEQRAIATAFQKLVDEHTYWLVVNLRWKQYRKDTSKTLTQLPGLFVWGIGRQIGKMTFYQGIGRHSCEQIEDLLAQDLRTLSDFLGEKMFMMGDNPTEVDCSVFGQLAQVRWHTPDVCKGKQLLLGELPNLLGYLERMKERIWPEWDECVTQGFTKEATK